MKNLLLLVIGAGSMLAQDTLYAHVDFVKPAQGKAGDYHKALMSAVVPKYQKAVDANEAYALLNLARRFPHGSGLAASEVRIALGKTLKSVSTGVTNDAGMPPGLFSTIAGELWVTAHTHELSKFFQAKHYRVLFLKTLPGKLTVDIVNAYKALPPSTPNGYVIFARNFRGPEDEATHVVMHGYTDLDQVPVMQGTGGATPEAMARLRELRTVLRIELWDRRAEFVGPKP